MVTAIGGQNPYLASNGVNDDGKDGLAGEAEHKGPVEQGGFDPFCGFNANNFEPNFTPENTVYRGRFASKEEHKEPVKRKAKSSVPRNPLAAVRHARMARDAATDELNPALDIGALLDPPEVAPAAAPKKGKITLKGAADTVTARVKALFPFGRNPAAIPAGPAAPVPAPAAPPGAAREKLKISTNRVKNFAKVLGSFGWRQAATPKPAEKTINPVLLQKIKNETQIETAFKNYETAINECDSFVRVQMKEKTTFYTRFSCRKKPPKLSPQEFIAKYNSLMEERVKAKSKASDALDAAYTIVNSLRNSVKPLAESYCDEQFSAKLNKLNELNEKFIQFLNRPKFIFKYARITADAYKIALEEQEKFLNDPKLGEIENCTQGFKRAVFGGEKPVSHEELRRKFEKLQENRLNAKFKAEDAFSLGEELLSIKGEEPLNIKKTQDLKEFDRNIKQYRQEFAKRLAKSEKSEKSLATLASIKEKKLTRLSDLEDRVKRDIGIHLPKISEETPGFVTKVQTDEAGAHIAKVTERLEKVTGRLDNNKQKTKKELQETLAKLENATRECTGTVLLNTQALTNAPAAAPPTSTRVFTKYNPVYLSTKMAGYSMLGASSAAAISNMLGVDPSSTGSVIGNTLHSAATGTLTSAPNALRQAGNFASAVASGVSYGLQTAADNKVSRAVYAAAEKVVESTGNDPSDEFVQGGLMTVPVLGKVLLTEVVARKTKAHLGSAAATVVRGVGYTAAAAPVVKMGFDKFAPQLKVAALKAAQKKGLDKLWTKGAEQAGAIYSSLPTIETSSWLPSTEGIGTAISTHGGAVMGAVSSALLVKSAAATLDDLNLPTAAKATRVVGYTASAAPLIESVATSMGVMEVVASNLSGASAAVRNIVSSLPEPLAVLPSVDTVLNTVTTGAKLGGALVVAEGTRRLANKVEAAGWNWTASKIRLGGYGASFLASAKVYADLTGVTAVVSKAVESPEVTSLVSNGIAKAASCWQSVTSFFASNATQATTTPSCPMPSSVFSNTTATVEAASSYMPSMPSVVTSAAEAVSAHPYVAAGVIGTALTAAAVYKLAPKGTIPAALKWAKNNKFTLGVGASLAATAVVAGVGIAVLGGLSYVISAR